MFAFVDEIDQILNAVFRKVWISWLLHDYDLEWVFEFLPFVFQIVSYEVLLFYILLYILTKQY